MKIHLLGLFAIIFVSACVNIPGFGTGGIQTEELPPDIITIQNVNTIPNPPINTRDQFSISFEINNQDDVNEVDKVSVQLFDYGLCDPLTDSFTPTGWETDPVHSFDFDSFAPGQTEFVEMVFLAPSNEEVGRLQTTCPVRFKTNYEFTSSSQVNTRVITADRLRQLQREGETPTFTPTETLGRGPIKISFSFGSALPIRASTETNPSVLPIFITVEDKGQGLFGDVPIGALVLKVPNVFVQQDCSRFVFDSDEGDLKVYKNNRSITMINKKSTQQRCSFTVPNEAAVVLEKTYFLSANLTYNYSLTNDVNIQIKPTLTT